MPPGIYVVVGLKRVYGLIVVMCSSQISNFQYFPFRFIYVQRPGNFVINPSSQNLVHLHLVGEYIHALFPTG